MELSRRQWTLVGFFFTVNFLCSVIYTLQQPFYPKLAESKNASATEFSLVFGVYDDFSTPTFDGDHHLIKGGSFVTTGNAALHFSRYAFRRHFYQHAGFRYIRSTEIPKEETAYYETDSLLTMYLEFHFGHKYLGVPNYPVTIVQHALNVMGTHPKIKAMDLGAAVGRASFELARHFDEVVGVDFSVRFIQSAVSLQQRGTIQWQNVEEGDLVSFNQVTLTQLDLTPQIVNKVKFVQGDACNLKESFVDFDLVIAANLIDRLYDPLEFLESIKKRIRRGGVLALSSPYTWLAEHTQKSKWLGGFKDAGGENVWTLTRLEQILSKSFDLICPPRDVEFVIRETKRKFQHTFAQLTLWRKK